MQVCPCTHALARFLAEDLGTARPEQLSEKQMSDIKDRGRVCDILAAMELTTADVPEADTKRCDLRAHDGEGEQYLIEVKGFHDNANIGSAMREDRVHVGERSLVRSNVVEEQVRAAIKQLKATPTAEKALWLVVLMSRTTYGSDVTLKQIHGTLYGIRPIIYGDSSGRCVSRDCLYFSHSAFHRHPELDGAIVIDQESAGLCLNDFGRRVERVRDSVLCRHFAKKGALSDAASLESGRGFFWADCGLDRKDKHAVLEYVKNKYCLEYALDAAPTEHSAMARVASTHWETQEGQQP